MPVAIAQGRAQLALSGATQTFSADLGGTIPELALFRMSGASLNATRRAGGSLSRGATDGTNDSCMGIWLPDNQTLSSNDRNSGAFGNPGNADGSDGQCVRLHSRAAGQWTLAGPEMFFDAFVADGVRVTIDRFGDEAYYCDYILFGGTDFSAEILNIDPSGAADSTTDHTGLGVPADLVLCWRYGAALPVANSSVAQFYEGFWSRSAHSNPQGIHVASSWNYDVSDDLLKARQDVRTDSIASDIIWTSGGSPPQDRIRIEEHASGFTIRRVDLNGSNLAATFVAMNFNNTKRAWVGVIPLTTAAAPTVQTIEDPLLRPDLVMHATCRRTSTNGISTDPAVDGTTDSSVLANGAGEPGNTAGNCSAVTDEHDAATTVSSSWSDNRFLILPNPDGLMSSDSIRATMGNQLARGFDLNFTGTDETAADLMAICVIGDEQTLTPDPAVLPVIAPTPTDITMQIGPPPAVLGVVAPAVEVLGEVFLSPDAAVLPLVAAPVFTGFVFPDAAVLPIVGPTVSLIAPAAPPPPPPSAGDIAFRGIFDLLPRGLLWRRLDTTTLAKLIRGWAEEYGRVDTRALTLLDEADPRTTLELLAEWEVWLGIAEDCGAVEDTITERRFAVFTKLTSPGGQNKFHFQELAAALGYDVTVDDILDTNEFKVGISTVGDALSNGESKFVWTVIGTEYTPRFFRAGANVAGEPLMTFGNTLLECAFEKAKPAHTQVDFVYTRPWTGYAPWTDLYPLPAVIAILAPTPLRI